MDTAREKQLSTMIEGVFGLSEMVNEWSEMVEQITWARRWVPSGVKGFTSGTKEEIEHSLDATAEFLRKGRTKHTDAEILAKIAEVRAVVGVAEGYVEIKEKRVEVTDPEYVEIRETIYDTPHGDLSVTIRMYTVGDKRIYKEFEGRKVNRILSEEEGEEVRAEYDKRTNDVKAKLAQLHLLNQ